jgi:putative peptidoglycan lipid II flippase
VLQVFSIGLFSFSVFQLELRAFYAMQDTRTPALINLFAVGINTVADVVFVRFWKVEGLALGHATAYTFAALTAGVILRRRLGGLDGRRLGVSVAKITAGGALAGGAAFLVSRGMASSLGSSTFGLQLLQVGAGVVAGIVVFLGASMAFHLKELTLIRQMILERVHRR